MLSHPSPAARLGWGGAITDPEVVFTPIYRNHGANGVGAFDDGDARDDPLDALAAASSHEADPAMRNTLIKQAPERENAQLHELPLYRQVIPWAAWKNVSVVHRPDNRLEISWLSVKQARRASRGWRRRSPSRARRSPKRRCGAGGPRSS